MLKIAFTTAVLALSGGAVFAQDAVQDPVLWPGSVGANVLQMAGRENIAAVGVLFRVSTIEGEWLEDDSTLTFDDYDDIFQEGAGFRVEFTGLAKAADAWVGGYIAAGLDVWDGDSASSGGLTVEPEEMSVFSAVLGARGQLSLGDTILLGATAGFGAVRYADVDAKVGGVDGVLFKRTTEFMVEVGVRLTIKAGPILLEGGVDFRHMEGPRDGDFPGLTEPREIRSFGFLFGGAIGF